MATAHSSKNETSPVRTQPRRTAAFALSGVTLALMLAMGVAPVRAAGFGEVQVGSQLGERLYARVPLIGAGTSGITAACVKVVTEPVLQDAPALANARIGIDHGSTPPAIVVLTPAPVLEPAVRFVLELGCGNQLRREFVLLIDPPDLPSVQVATATPLPSAARVVPGEGSRWGAAGVPPAAPDTASAPLAQAAPSAPPTQAAAAAPAVAPKPRPKPRVAARPKPVAKAQAPSAPPPPARPPQAARPAGTDRLVLADVDPAAARGTPDAAAAAAAEQAAKAAAREEALTRQIEALTREVARMREDMDKLATRNRELQSEAENSRTGWFAAGGLGIALAGIALGLLGRREKKKSWRDNLSPAFDEPEGPRTAAAPRPTPPADPVAAPKPAAPVAAATGFHLTSHDVSDLDVTKIDVQESVGHTLMNAVAGATPATAPAGTTMFPSDAAASTLTAEERATIGGPLQSLDFSLDDIDLNVPTATQPRRTSPVFEPSGPTAADSEAARAKLFEEIEVVHRASRSKA